MRVGRPGPGVGGCTTRWGSAQKELRTVLRYGARRRRSSRLDLEGHPAAVGQLALELRGWSEVLPRKREQRASGDERGAGGARHDWHLRQ